LKLRTPKTKEKKHRTSCSKNSYRQKYKNRQFLWEIIIIKMIRVQKECNKVSSSKNTSYLNPRNDEWSHIGKWLVDADNYTKGKDQIFLDQMILGG
jgi:hypothetical protein